MEQFDSNTEVVERFQRSRPYLVGIDHAKNIIPGFQELTVLHAGPAIRPADMNGPMRGAAIGSLVYEGIERDHAVRLLDAGELDLRPCHDVGFVGPMAGVVTGRMPVWVVEDQEFGNRSYATLNEGLGKVLRFGASDGSVMQRLRWMEMELAPALNDALVLHGPIDLKDSISEALRRGDEAHNRNKAGTASFVRELAPELVESCGRAAAPILEFLRSNDHFFLNISMASSKCSADAAHDAGKGSVVTAMTTNGHNFGIRVSGLGSHWVVASAIGHETGVYFEPYTKHDAASAIGDSYISEVVGLGGFSMAAAPAIASFVGGKASEMAHLTTEMYEITLAEHDQFRIPSLDYRGAPLGIEVDSVVATGILPVMNSGIAHRKPGFGQVGAGIARAPMACFEDAQLLLKKQTQVRAERAAGLEDGR